jgi:hypothetical protein
MMKRSVTPAGAAATPRSGLSTIAAITLLGRLEIINSKLIKLDAQLFLRVSQTESIVGSVRFYNEGDIYFSEDEPMLYYIDTTVESFLAFLSLCIHCQTKFARVPQGNDNGLTVSGEEYDFVGDLQSVHICHFLFSSFHPIADTTGRPTWPS